MITRLVVTTVVIAVGLLLPAAAVAERPNFVVVMTDDQPADSLAVMNQLHRGIVEQGVTFRQHFISFPLCCPSRATFLTGQYAHNHGVEDNAGPKGGFGAFRDSGTLPIALRRSGYQTGFFGKYLNGYGGRGVPPGWSSWNAVTRPAEMFNPLLNVNGRLNRIRGYQTDVFAQRASEWIRRSSGKRPFFAWVTPFAPHLTSYRSEDEWPNPTPAPRHRGSFRNAPFPTSPAFGEPDVSDKPEFVRSRPAPDADDVRYFRRVRSDQLASLQAVDDMIGRLQAQLRRQGELADTYLFFVADNGWMMGEHRLQGKHRLYDVASRFPLIVRGPGVASNEDSRSTVSNVDLPATILDAANVAPLRAGDGRSLLPLLRRPKTSTPGERVVLLEDLVNGSAGVAHHRWTYIEHLSGEVELYDRAQDPHQLQSLHADPSYDGVERTLAEDLKELRDCRGDDCGRYR